MFGIKNVVIKRPFADFVINSDVGKVCENRKRNCHHREKLYCILKGSERVAPGCSSCCGAFLSHPGLGQHDSASEDWESGTRLRQEHAGGAQQVQGQENILGRK